MADIDSLKLKLATLLKNNEASAFEPKRDDSNAVDGFDDEDPLTYTDLYRDEQGNRLPSKLQVVPLFGNPILPSQIATIQLRLEWLDVITDVINSSHHTFAMFSLPEELATQNRLTLNDFPQTGTVVRLLSARTSSEEIDIVCEGLRRVSLIRVLDTKQHLAQVRYPEIEYRLANPTNQDKLVANTQALRQSLQRSLELDKRIQKLEKELKEYARSIGLVIKREDKSYDYTYYLYHDHHTIGRLSLIKLRLIFDFFGLDQVNEEQRAEISRYLARPSKEELAQVQHYISEIKKLVREREEQIENDLKNLGSKAREVAANFMNLAPESVKTILDLTSKVAKSKSSEENKVLSDKDLEQTKHKETNKAKNFAEFLRKEITQNLQNAFQATHPDAQIVDVEVTEEKTAIAEHKDNEQAREQSTEAKEATKATASVASKASQENDDEEAEKELSPSQSSKFETNLRDFSYISSKFIAGKMPKDALFHEFYRIGDSTQDSKAETKEQKQAYFEQEQLNESFVKSISDFLEGKSSKGEGLALNFSEDVANFADSEKKEALIKQLVEVDLEEERYRKAQHEKSQEISLHNILANTPKEPSASQDVKEGLAGPNIGFINEDTSIVTFASGTESSEELLLRLTEIQKEHERKLKEAQEQQDKQSNAAEQAEGEQEAEGATDSKKKSKSKKNFKASKIKEAKQDASDESDADTKEHFNGQDFFITSDAKEDQVTKKNSIISGNDLSNLAEMSDEESKNLDFGTATHLILGEDEKISDEVKDYISFIMKNQGEDGELRDDIEITPKGKSKPNRWSALQRAALIRSKLAKILGGRVIFGVSPLDAQQEGVQQDIESRAYCLGITAALQELIPLNPLMTEEMRQYIARFDMSNPSILADCAASITQSKAEELQEVLDTIAILPRLKLSFELISRELSAAKLQDKIKLSVAEKIQKRQKDFFLREQLTEIKKELGLSADEKDLDLEKFRERMAELAPPEHIAKRFKEEIDKLSVLETMSPEYGTTRNYIDILTSIPWGKTCKERFSKNKQGKLTINLERARKILDEDHEGLQDVKDRIIEFLAVGALKGQTSGQIMLFVGPPGVGKTSIGKSIARALNRPFYRLSLGGIDDVSEIKGHRKTYVGAMPGKIVSALRETKVMNPVIMLDEIDKLGKSYRGDPDAALLETLDPEQNKNFLDVYLDEKLDLSNCLFICTANSTDTISAPLLDRMDPIRLSGYIAKEKFAIAKKHLLPRALNEAGIKNSRTIKISDETLSSLIEGYARESGVRSLERAISKLIRKAAVKLVEGQKSVKLETSDLEEYLGTAPFKKEKMLSGVGIMTGLAWTASGGVTLPVESIIINQDSANFKLTGSLGDVMKESANIAYSFVQSHLSKYAPKKCHNFFKKANLHLHVPEGAIPKDGPSAGVTMSTSLLSLALNEAPQAGFAMTGELTLTGHVLPIGGLREKVIAARRMGIFDLIIPIGNAGDVKELPEQVRSKVTFYYADTYDDVAYTLFKSTRTLLARKGIQAPKKEVFDAEGKAKAVEQAVEAIAEQTPVVAKAKSKAAKPASSATSATKSRGTPEQEPSKAASSTRTTKIAVNKTSLKKPAARKSTTKSTSTKTATSSAQKPSTRKSTAKKTVVTEKKPE